VAVGQGTNSIAYSYDGINWTATTNLFPTNGIKVLWNGKMFVSAGYGGPTLAYSYNGINWTPVSSTINGHGLAWNGTMWMATDGAYSYDGITWSASTYAPKDMYIIWSGNAWLSQGFGSSTLSYSYDGVQWYGLGKSIFTGNGICSCSDLFQEYSNTTITMQTPVVAVGSSPNSIAYSEDGIQWKGLGNTLFTGGGFAVAYSGSRWVAGGQGTHTLAYSDDGLNWIGLGATIFTGGCYEIAYNGSLWVAVGQGTNTIAYSYDGKTWTAVPNSFFSIANTVAWNGSRWIAGGGYNSTLATSLDGKVWSPIAQTSGINVVIGLEYNGSMWIAGGVSGNSDYSVNGLVWTNGISFSNGITWTNGVSPVSSLAVTTINKVPLIYSYNGDDWFPVPNPILTSFESLAWNGKMWVALGYSTSFTMTYSYDGLQWAGVPNSLALFPTGPVGITWNGLRWIVVGNGSGADSMAYSVNGLQWIGMGKTIMGSGYGIGPRIIDAKLSPGDDHLRFTMDSYFQKGYTNLTIGASNTLN
jgi:hypothetical protein